jgi:hypothetical protein
VATDRARMFQLPTSGDPMHVTLTDTAITARGTTARVRCVQSFSRGGFSDRGPKERALEILLVKLERRRASRRSVAHASSAP